MAPEEGAAAVVFLSMIEAELLTVAPGEGVVVVVVAREPWHLRKVRLMCASRYA